MKRENKFLKLKNKKEFLEFQVEITKNLSEGVSLVRLRDGKIIYTNSRFEKMFGYSPDEMIGKHVSILNFPIQESPKKIAKKITTKIKKTRAWSGEIKNIKKDGTPFWCSASVSLYKHSEHGDVAVTVHADITERKKLEEREHLLMHTLRAIRGVNQLIAKEKNKTRLLKSTCKLLAKRGSFGCVFIGLFNEEWGVGETYCAGSHPPTKKQFKLIYNKDFIKEIKKRPLLKISDVTKGRYKQHFSKVQKHGAIAVRLKHNKIVYGGLTVHLVPGWESDKEEVSLIRGLADDISLALHAIKQEEKKTEVEREVLILKKFYQEIVDRVVTGIWVTDEEDVIFYTNKATENIAGIPAGKIRGRRVLKDFPKSTLKFFRPYYLKAKRSLKPVRYDSIPVVTPAGRQSYQSGWLIVRKKNGKYGGIICTIEDVTKEKRDLRKLEESEQRFHDIAMSSADWVWEVGRNGKYTYASGKIKEILGYDIKEIIGRTPFDLMPPEEVVRVGKIFKKIVRNKEPIVDLENWNLTKDGEEVCLLTRGVPILDEGGELLGYRGVDKDITERKMIEKTKTEFVSLASHQLTTPLTIINWSLENILSENKSLDGNIQDKIKDILGASKRMTELVRALLNVSRIETGTFAVKPEVFNFCILFEKIINEILPKIKEKNITFTKRCGKKIKRVKMDKELLQIIIQNLLTNALKYTPSGGRVDLRIKKQKEDLLIKVSDTGCGIPKKDYKKVFSKFYRSDIARKIDADGTGLGLYTVKSVLDRVGGRAWFDSRVNGGTTFYALIPKKITIKKGKKRLEVGGG